MAKPYEVYGIPETLYLEYDRPPEYATIYPVNDRPWDSNELKSWQVGLWGRAEYWTALEAALLITEICPDDPDIYSVTEEISQNEGYGTSYYCWKHEFQWEVAERLLFLLERSPLAPKSAPVDWIRYYRDKCLNYFDSPFVGTKFGETWLEFFCKELIIPTETTNFPSFTQTETIERAHVSDNLAILHQAATRFWANADRNDRTTHPSKADVVAWLIERGFSQKLADSGATIIRPEWAPTGRKAEE